MDRALARLLFLRFRGGVRHRLRQLASPRGAVFLLAIGGIVWLLLGTGTPSPGDGLGGGPLQDPNSLREHVGNFMPLGLLGLTLFTVFVARGRAFHFSPNEINFLFTGPFSHRDLIVYKFCAYLAGAILSAAIVVPFVPARTGTALATFTGSLLTILFIQLSSAAIGTFGQAFEAGWITRARRPALVLVLAMAAAAMFYAGATSDSNILDVLSIFRQSWLGTIVLAPFIVFAKLFIARKIFPDLIMWTTAAIIINACLLLAIIALDDRTADRSLSESRRLSNRWNRIRQGGSFWASEKTTGHSVRHSPMLGGLGPIAWRQAINAVRNSGRVIVVFLAIAAFTGPLATTAGIQSADSRTIAALYFFIAFIVPRTLVCDFRGDLGRIETYKALPVASWRICIGQLVVPVVLSSAIGLVMIFSTMFFLDGTGADIAIALAAFALPFNLLLYGVENLVFLLFPAKLVPVGRVDFEFLGRTMVEFVAKTIIIFAVLAMAVGVGLIVLHASGKSWISFGLASWLSLAIIASLTVPMLGYAFRRFTVGETIA